MLADQGQEEEEESVKTKGQSTNKENSNLKNNQWSLSLIFVWTLPHKSKMPAGQIDPLYEQ